MSLLAQTVEAIEDAMKLAGDLRRAGDTFKELAQEIRHHDRRITSLEAQSETRRVAVSSVLGMRSPRWR